MCGLVGFSGTTPDLNALKILGFYNDTRGGDACGFAINNEVYKTSNFNLDKFSKLFTKKEGQTKFINKSNKSQIILMHTRKGSAGGNSDEQAHPCRVIDSNGRVLIGIHNGTIRNIDDLVHKYLGDSDIVFQNSDTDSLKLYTILSETGNYDVLTEYEGGAALLWYYLDEPTTMYAFKGASESSYPSYSAYATSYEDIKEERPLFWGKLGNSIYFSSIQESLFAINVLEVFSLSQNIVFTIKNGNITKNADIKKVTPYYIPTPRQSSYNDVHKGAYKNKKDLSKKYLRIDMQEATNDLVHLNKAKESAFYLDEMVYMQNGTPMSGIYYLHYNNQEGYLVATEIENISYINLKSFVNYSKQCNLDDFIKCWDSYRESKKISESLSLGTYAIFYSGMLLNTDLIHHSSDIISSRFKKGLVTIKRLKDRDPYYWLDKINSLQDSNLNDIKIVSELTKEPIVVNSNNVYHKGLAVSKTYSYSLIPEVKVKMDNTKIVEVTDFQLTNGTTFTSEESREVKKNSKIQFKEGDDALLNVWNSFPGHKSKEQWACCTIHSINDRIGTITVKLNLEIKVGKIAYTYLSVTDLNNLMLIEEDGHKINDTVYHYDEELDSFEEGIVKVVTNLNTIGISFNGQKTVFYRDLNFILSKKEYDELMDDEISFTKKKEVEVGSTVYDIGNYDPLEVLKINISPKGIYSYRVYNKSTAEVSELKSSDFIVGLDSKGSENQIFKAGDTVYRNDTKESWEVIRELTPDKIYVKRAISNGGNVFQSMKKVNLMTEKEFIENESEPDLPFKNDWLSIFNDNLSDKKKILEKKELTSLELIEQLQNKKINIEKMTDLINKIEKNKNAIKVVLKDNKDTELPQILIDKMEILAVCLAGLEDFVATGNDILKTIKESSNV